MARFMVGKREARGTFGSGKRLGEGKLCVVCGKLAVENEDQRMSGR